MWIYDVPDIVQVVLAWPRQIWQGRLEEHIEKLCDLKNSDPGSEPRPEVLHPPQLDKQRPPEIEHPRHHERELQRGLFFTTRPDHRPGQWHPPCGHTYAYGSPTSPFSASDPGSRNVRAADRASCARPYDIRNWNSGYAPSTWTCALCRAGCPPGALAKNAPMTVIAFSPVALYFF